MFIGQSVEEAESLGKGTIALSLRNGNLIVECPWRVITAEGEVISGYTDLLRDDSRLQADNVKRVLEGKLISEIRFSEPADLTVRFHDGTRLELFHDSFNFEGWQLSCEDGSFFVSLPGGTVTEFT